MPPRILRGWWWRDESPWTWRATATLACLDPLGLSRSWHPRHHPDVEMGRKRYLRHRPHDDSHARWPRMARNAPGWDGVAMETFPRIRLPSVAVPCEDGALALVVTMASSCYCCCCCGWTSWWLPPPNSITTRRRHLRTSNFGRGGKASADLPRRSTTPCVA